MQQVVRDALIAFMAAPGHAQGETTKAAQLGWYRARQAE
jgi:hypothetical protein